MATRKTTSSTPKTTTKRAAAAKSSTTKATSTKTAAKRSTTRKTAAKKPAAAKTAATTTPTTANPTSAIKGVTLAKPAGGPKAMTKKELFEKVKKASGVKGSDTRKVMEAVLEELGAALVRGEALKLNPLGVMKVQRQKTASDGDLVVCKLKRKKAGGGDKDPLADAAE